MNLESKSLMKRWSVSILDCIVSIPSGTIQSHRGICLKSKLYFAVIPIMDRVVARNIRRLRELHGFDRRALEEKAGIAYGILDQIEALHKPA